MGRGQSSTVPEGGRLWEGRKVRRVKGVGVNGQGPLIQHHSWHRAHLAAPLIPGYLTIGTPVSDITDAELE